MDGLADAQAWPEDRVPAVRHPGEESSPRYWTTNGLPGAGTVRATAARPARPALHLMAYDRTRIDFLFSGGGPG